MKLLNKNEAINENLAARTTKRGETEIFFYSQGHFEDGLLRVHCSGKSVIFVHY